MKKGKKNTWLRNANGKIRWYWWIVGVALTIIIFKLLISLLFSAVDDVSTGINTTIVGFQAGTQLTTARKVELKSLADKVYTSMAGPGAYYNDWVSYMKEINNDVEYAYFDTTAFGERDDHSFSSWYTDEVMIGQGSKDLVNIDYESKQMTTRV